MIARKVLVIAFIGLIGCNNVETKFGKSYNSVRVKYGSPVIHEYMQLRIADPDFENWRIPAIIHDTIQTGFHAGKSFYIHEDSILQEDDIFRKRINDSTFAFVAILTYGNLKRNKFRSIYYDSVDARMIELDPKDYLNERKTYRDFISKELTLAEADSILIFWGTSRFK